MMDWDAKLRREREWLSGLKAGDEVALSVSWSTPSLAKITHATATQLRIGHSKFRRKDGRAMGDTWSRTSLIEPAAEIRQQIEELRLRKILAMVKWEKLPFDEVKAVLAIVRPASDSDAPRTGD